MGERASVLTRSEDQTRALGEALGRAVQAGDVLLLDGAFGAGKTTLVQGLARGLGVADQVTSPSFVIACEYDGRAPLFHIDLYRVEQMDGTTLEALAEYFGGSGVCVVEWPGALPPDLVRDATRILLRATGETERQIEIETASERLRDAFVAFSTDARALQRSGGAGHRNHPRH
ncbi:MAG TPA: tRNA (adenosine(37)-N6)-threonylcarbamoyltransferase complex ATPase subunit type 1 TsaE [Chloroflexota bacterium]|nr:tRNA (adenosine(37)-N6)-threonylcarbamoyltransferase complex ATPase subunit type 1 TsaE [Chloroflexota bacterium]